MTKQPGSYNDFADGETAPQSVPPRDALCIIGTWYYKIGLRGKVFWWDLEQWRLSTTMSVELVRSAKPLQWGKKIKVQKIKKAKAQKTKKHIFPTADRYKGFQGFGP